MDEIRHLHVRPMSRRSFLVTAGNLGIGVAFGGLLRPALGAVMARAATGDFRPNAWVTIAADGIVSIMSPASEMGQGALTSNGVIVSSR